MSGDVFVRRPIPLMLFLALVAVACSRPDSPGKPASPALSKEPVEAPRPAQLPYEEPMVGGARVAAASAILDTLAASKDHAVLLRALRQSGLDRELAGPGPFTVFAPTDAAFRGMAGGYERLLAPEAQAELRALLEFHVVAGKLDSFALGQQVAAGNGTALLATLQGGMLRATIADGAAVVKDGNGGLARITVPDVQQGNGVVYVVDGVLRPAKAAESSKPR